jgi:2-iminobutanoate/2-iminopropanoate deaminase
MTTRKAVSSNEAPAAIGPYSQAIEAAGMVFLSGQIPLDPVSGEIVRGGIEAETERVLQNIAGVLKAAGCGFDNVVRTTIFLTDLANFAAVNAIYTKYFTGTPPARVTIQVSALPRGAQVEIDAIAVKG